MIPMNCTLFSIPTRQHEADSLTCSKVGMLDSNNFTKCLDEVDVATKFLVTTKESTKDDVVKKEFSSKGPKRVVFIIY